MVVHLLLLDQILIWVKIFLNRNKKDKRREKDTNNERREREHSTSKKKSSKEAKEKSDKSTTTLKVSCVTQVISRAEYCKCNDNCNSLPSFYFFSSPSFFPFSLANYCHLGLCFASQRHESHSPIDVSRPVWEVCILDWTYRTLLWIGYRNTLFWFCSLFCSVTYVRSWLSAYLYEQAGSRLCNQAAGFRVSLAVLWFNCSWQISTTQPFTHSPAVGRGRESEE